jgi:hypothetical protein
MRVRTSLALLKLAVHTEIDRCLDAGSAGCVELVRTNEHIELYEYPSRRTPLRRRLKTTIYAFTDEPGVG